MVAVEVTNWGLVMAKATSIKPETTVSIVILGGILGSLFTAYQVFSPAFEQIKINESQLVMHQELLKSLQSSQINANQHLLKISNSLSRIEGRMQK